jgi:hypothetical protein
MQSLKREKAKLQNDHFYWEDLNMPMQFRGWLAACATLVSMMSSSLAVAQGVPSPPPIMPPSIPSLNTVNLMTAEGAAALGARWKVMDVKIVDVPPMQGALPQYKSTYMIEPRAHTANFRPPDLKSFQGL